MNPGENPDLAQGRAALNLRATFKRSANTGQHKSCVNNAASSAVTAFSLSSVTLAELREQQLTHEAPHSSVHIQEALPGNLARGPCVSELEGGSVTSSLWEMQGGDGREDLACLGSMVTSLPGGRCQERKNGDLHTSAGLVHPWPLSHSLRA